MFKFIDTIIDKIEGIQDYALDKEKCLELTRVNLINSIDENKKVLIVGSTSEDIINEVADDLYNVCKKNNDSIVISSDFSASNENELTLCIASDITSDPRALLIAKQCDTVIFVVEKNKSKLANIDKSVLKLRELGKEVLGFVVV